MDGSRSFPERQEVVGANRTCPIGLLPPILRGGAVCTNRVETRYLGSACSSRIQLGDRLDDDALFERVVARTAGKSLD
jgi:hypothetical protein